MILLPLRHRGKTHARIMGALSPAAIPAWIGLKPVTQLRTVTHRVIWPSGRPLPPEASADQAAARRRRLVIHPGGRA
jgi:hypothetical protein